MGIGTLDTKSRPPECGELIASTGPGGTIPGAAAEDRASTGQPSRTAFIQGKPETAKHLKIKDFSPSEQEPAQSAA
jgi:hypothetical protein